MSEQVFMSVGGRKQVLMGADPNDPANIIWNFGLEPKTKAVDRMIRAQPYLWDAFPAMKGRWDGKSTVNHYKAVQQVLGDKAEDLIQLQPRGTCGGRSGSAAGDFVQCILIAAGKRKKFHRVSHAAVYFAARKKYGMLNGRWQDDNNDGVASGAVPEALSSVTGYVTREEDGDLNWYGDGSDDLACKLGAGMLPDVAAKIMELGKDNLITWAPVRSFAEMADGIAAGGVGIGSDNQGFTMTRDSRGYCSPSGQWAHYQIRVGVHGSAAGLPPGCPYWQSWGKTTPGGPRLLDYPGNVFGVTDSVQDSVIRSGDWAVVFGFDPFELESQNYDIPWVFGS